MFEKLENYLNQWVDEGKADYYLSALECLQSYGFVAAWTEISDMLEGEVNLPVSAILDNLEVIIQVGMDRVLAEHAISAHEGSLRVKTQILNGLKMLSEDERHQEIIDICDNGEDVVHQLSDLLALVDQEAGSSWVDYADQFTFVSNGLISRLREVHEQALTNQEDSPAMVSPEKQLRFQKLRVFIGKNPESLAAKAILEDSTPIGLPLQTLLNTYGETIESYDTKLPLLVAISLVGLVLLSDTPMDRLANTAKDLIDDYFADIDFVSQVAEAMDPILNEVILNE